MHQTWENSKKLNLNLILADLTQIWAQKSFYMDFTSSSS